MRRYWLAGCFLCAALAQAQPRWRFEDLGSYSLNGAYMGSGSDVSESGLVAGVMTGAYTETPLVYEPGYGYTPTGPIGDSYEHIKVSSDGFVSGSYFGRAGGQFAAVWDRAGGARTLQVPAGVTHSSAGGIAESGRAVGVMKEPGRGQWGAYWAPGQVGRYLFGPPGSGAVSSTGDGVNRFGQVAGTYVTGGHRRGFLWDEHAGYIDAGMPGWAQDLDFDKLLDDGTALGNAWSQNGTWGFVREPDGSYVQIRHWNPAFGAEARDIDSQGMVVGSARQGLQGGSLAYVWRKDWGMLDLNGLVDGIPQGAWLSFAGGVSDSGYITGTWTYTGAVGSGRAFLLHPVPEPSCLAILGFGVLLLRRKPMD